MIDLLLLIALPYLAIGLLVFGTIYRCKKDQFSISALSSQFLENKQLLWGTIPWHLGILIIFVGHLIPFLVPGLWQALTSNRAFLLGVETIGVAAALLCIFGLLVALVRRITVAKVQQVTSVMDLAILILLLGQITLGLGVALSHRWGAVWSTQTTTPYLWSLITFQPNMNYVAELPPMAKLHITGAWIILSLVPFSRLIHMFFIPIAYLWRAPQLVIWANPRRFQWKPQIVQQEATRRHFLHGLLGIGAGVTLLTAGVMDKFYHFFRGPIMTPEQEEALLQKRLDQLQMTAEQRALQLERMRSDFIHVAKLGELSPRSGKYFIDYQMRPALAFRDTTGMPLLISAKCTHLGCTVAQDLDSAGRILCPCHMSYFDLQTGAPVPGAVATDPLPHIGWILMDVEGNIVSRQRPGAPREEMPTIDNLEQLDVYIAKEFEELA